MDTPKTAPIGGTDYPTTWVQFLDWFHCEQACRDYLEERRWADGLICPKCGVISPVERMSRGRLICPACRHQATATAGTIFAKTRTELRVWFAAIWYITSQKHGVSALGLQRVLGLGSYETAWSMLPRLRRAMVRPDRELLPGEVEVDETYLALTDRENPISAVGRKSNTTKVLVVIAVERLHPKGFGRIRIRPIDRGDYENLMPFIRASVGPGAVIHRDGSPAYKNLEDNGYGHRRTVHLGSDTPAHDIDARGSPSCLIASALDDGHAPWCCAARTVGLLPRRICVAVQSQNLAFTGIVVLSFAPASCHDQARDLRGNRGSSPKIRKLNSCGAKGIPRVPRSSTSCPRVPTAGNGSCFGTKPVIG